MQKNLHEPVQNSPFRKAYWFARYLVNTDQYGAIGRQKESGVLSTVSSLEDILKSENMTDEERLQKARERLSAGLLLLYKKGKKAYGSVLNLVEKLDREIESLEDVAVFCITMRDIVAPINRAIDLVPSNDRDFCKKKAASILDTYGEKKAGLVISTWDDLGEKGCLDAERVIINDTFAALTASLSKLSIPHSKTDDMLLSTAFIQEFERRLGQKRKSRAGGSLEDVATFLFDYYKFSNTDAPSHFNQDLEVDKWFKCKDNWKIGISCKRTLRERWKQLSQADRGTLSHFKVKELWHLITYDKDLSDDKIVRLGEQGQIFYLMDDSKTYNKCKVHPGMKGYVRPLSHLVNDIRENIKGTI